MRQYLQDPDISDEDLLEKLNAVVSLEEKRSIKRVPKTKVSSIAMATNGSKDQVQPPQKSAESI